jgi:hypothetical protein
MKVKWNQQSAGSNGRGGRLEAVLVDGRLNGHEAIITQLGAIETRFLHVNIRTTREFHQGIFWKKVDQLLAELELKPEIQSAIEAQICEKVPRPSDDWPMWAVTCIPHYDK